MKIENAQFNFFENKDHYLTFRQAWKDYINSGKAKCETYTDYQGGTCKYPSNLECKHHLLYTLLRGKDIRKMFSPKGGSVTPYLKFEEAKRDILYAASEGRWSASASANLLQPFGDTIDHSTLVSLAEIIKDWEMKDPGPEVSALPATEEEAA